jgi:septal ring factor EnvC (AmiA/AmiB activator)
MLTAVAAIVLILASCQENKRTREQQDLRAAVDSTVNVLDNEISRLEDQLRQAANTTQQDLEGQVARLKQTRNDLDVQLDKMNNVAEDEWEEFKRSVEQSLLNAERTLQGQG